MEERLLAARRAFAASLPPSLRSAVEFYDFQSYNSAATLQDNILFGRLVYGQAQADTRIGVLTAEVLAELNLRDSVIDVGLEYNVGVAGKRLPATQRQKLGIARALIKRPQFLVVNEAVAVRGGGRARRGVDRQPAESGRAVRLYRGDAGRQDCRSRDARRPGGEGWPLCRADQEVCHQGDLGDAMYVILGGVAEVLIDTGKGQMRVAELKKNGFFGETAILLAAPRNATVKASESLLTLKISKDMFYSLVAEVPQMAIEVMRELAHRVEETNKKLSEATANKAA
jgi:hypothetical protein